MKHLKKFLFAMIAVCVTLCVAPATVKAGISPINVGDSSGFSDSLDSGKWYFRGVSGGDGAVVFGEDSDDSSRFVSRVKINNLKDCGYTLCFTASAELCIENVSQGARFGIMFGLSIPSDYAESENSTYLWFTGKGNALSVGISVYDGGEHVLLPARPVITEETGKVTVSIEVDTDGGARISVNDETILNDREARVSTEGYLRTATRRRPIVRHSRIFPVLIMQRFGMRALYEAPSKRAGSSGATMLWSLTTRPLPAFRQRQTIRTSSWHLT